ncbi:MAG: endonuclease/exonuclease/phosphatase family protein [Gammaproteobacteria bacterium]|nr:endonuclease/exonuclease/phosphatase family protein [Gammaproteobacteria bacterium]
MTSILSWNIQNGKGNDGEISLRRMADVIAMQPMPDVICLQEISRGLILSDAVGAPDQIDELSKLFPRYEVIFGVAVDAYCASTGGRWQFGNLVLTRLPLLSVLSHPLPRPGAGNKRHMTRQATEVVVAGTGGPLRIVNLHLEFHSELHRLAQVDRLRDLHQEALEERSQPPSTSPVGPYQSVPRPVDSVYCGDFNMVVGSREYRRMLAPLAEETTPFLDAWNIAHPDQPHDPTCGVYDQAQWPEGPHCRDFFFVSSNCSQAVRDVRVDGTTDASDHQPLMLELSGR